MANKIDNTSRFSKHKKKPSWLDLVIEKRLRQFYWSRKTSRPETSDRPLPSPKNR